MILSILKTFFIAISVVLQTNVSASISSCDEEFVEYKDIKCIKIIAKEEWSMTWSEANKICTKEYDGQLGSIHSEDENNFIFELAFGNTAIQRASNMWMGGKRSTGNNFVWIDGTPFNYTNWGKQTVQQSGDGDCMEMWSPWYSNDRGVPSDSGRWNNYECEPLIKHQFALCQKPINYDSTSHSCAYESEECGGPRNISCCNYPGLQLKCKLDEDDDDRKHDKDGKDSKEGKDRNDAKDGKHRKDGKNYKKGECIRTCATEGETCGGIAATQCCKGRPLECEIKGKYPDAGGKCIRCQTENESCDENMKCCKGLKCSTMCKKCIVPYSPSNKLY